MSENVQLALIVAIPPTFTALAGIIISWINHRQSDGKLNHITALTNSTLTAANARIEKLEKIVEELTGRKPG